jgi:hypothetical protein
MPDFELIMNKQYILLSPSFTFFFFCSLSEEVIVMLQKRKDSTELKGEMTMITCASRLKKVPDAPLDLADNNPTLVTPLKKM